MKKQLLTLALAAVLTPAFNANSQATLTEVWKYQGPELNADWDSNAPDWTSTDAIKQKSCTRFATGRDGRIYTINMKTMSIAEITKDGMKDLYKLPKLEGDDIYGTAISIDDAGNFLIGHHFTKAPQSSQVWSIYSPTLNEIKHFDLGYPNNMKPEDYKDALPGKNPLTQNTGIGRIDCVGRVVGDLTTMGAFYIAPYGNGAAYNIRYVFAGGEGDIEHIDLDGNKYSPTYLGSSNSANIVQPAISNIMEYGRDDEETFNTYILCSGEGGNWDVIGTYSSASPAYAACTAMQTAWRALPFMAGNNGFDSFVLKGHRYFVHSYIDSQEAKTNNTRPMDIAVFNELGGIVATWKNPDYASVYGYNSIIAQPQDDDTALIHVYTSTISTTIGDLQGCGAAAVLRFQLPDETQIEGTADNPIHIKTVEDFLKFPKKSIENELYVELDNDLDFTDTPYRVLFNEAAAKSKTLHFDGKNHVLRNITCAEGVTQNASVFGSVKGTIKNLGVENIKGKVNWYCTGGIAGSTEGDTEISNCYTTGSMESAASGGLVGACNSGTLKITDCYSRVCTIDTIAKAHTAGLVGRADCDLIITNAYASGTVTGGKFAAGIVNVRNATNVTLNNVIAWNPSVSNGNATDGGIDAVATGDATQNNVLIFDGMKVNGISVTGGTPAATLQSTATAWSAYHSQLGTNGMPILAWQDPDAAGITDIVADDENAPAVYYNLQGIQVANPEHGIYIVRRGNKVTKELIR